VLTGKYTWSQISLVVMISESPSLRISLSPRTHLVAMQPCQLPSSDHIFLTRLIVRTQPAVGDILITCLYVNSEARGEGYTCPKLRELELGSKQPGCISCIATDFWPGCLVTTSDFRFRHGHDGQETTGNAGEGNPFPLLLLSHCYNFRRKVGARR